MSVFHKHTTLHHITSLHSTQLHLIMTGDGYGDGYGRVGPAGRGSVLLLPAGLPSTRGRRGHLGRSHTLGRDRHTLGRDRHTLGRDRHTQRRRANRYHHRRCCHCCHCCHCCRHTQQWCRQPDIIVVIVSLFEVEQTQSRQWSAEDSIYFLPLPLLWQP